MGTTPKIELKNELTPAEQDLKHFCEVHGLLYPSCLWSFESRAAAIQQTTHKDGWCRILKPRLSAGEIRFLKESMALDFDLPAGFFEEYKKE